MCFQVEAAVTFYFFKATVLCAAPVTGERLAHHDVQQQVDKGRNEQNCERPKDVVICPGDTAAYEAKHYEHDTQSLREILSSVQIAARANEATMNLLAFNRARWDCYLLTTVRTIERARVGGNCFAGSAPAIGTIVRYVHRQRESRSLLPEGTSRVLCWRSCEGPARLAGPT
jgi:hypothetical protein